MGGEGDEVAPHFPVSPGGEGVPCIAVCGLLIPKYDFYVSDFILTFLVNYSFVLKLLM